MAKAASGGSDFEALARQYWGQWGEMMRSAAPPAATAAPSMPDWNQAAGWWSQMARGASQAAEAEDAVQRFNAQARGWFGQMQQLAAQFAGRDADAAEVARTWKQMLGGMGGNPFAEVFSQMGGPGQQGPEAWWQQARPMVEALQQPVRQWAQGPAFGFAREHQERWQTLTRAQLDAQAATDAYQALLGEAGQDAFERFENRLAERSEPGRQLTSARALFDLWIDAAEEAYAEIALSPRFREVYGRFVNAQMRLRAAVQGEIEHATAQMGMPTRTEIDAAHRKIVQLERELRRVRDRLDDNDDKDDNRAGKGKKGDSDSKPVGSPATRRASTAKSSRSTGKQAVKKKGSKKSASAAGTKSPARKAAARAPKPAASKASRPTAATPKAKPARAAAKRAAVTSASAPRSPTARAKRPANRKQAR
ncbi:class III poly(R)-hydroxyalkanoic acid synthase subunit PhaE [Lysobacter sp. A3-1-A15]|uniref:class III poly(R)-hydroxyalkanoic acid synthase subunit PhaE n=1 Tax=Novilysobacter viscosus TaxID=3098602 RepID=UPI002ED8A270